MASATESEFRRDLIGSDGAGVERGGVLEAEPVEHLLVPNRKLLAHLANEREHLFTFLTEPGVQATNWRAEQALRPAVTNRKHWGGNKTWQGAHTQHVLMSVIRTARQQQLDPVALLAGLARQPQPAVATQLRFPGRSPPQ